jgi:hypothetical protein
MVRGEYKVKNNLAIGMGLELVRVLQTFSQSAMIINFAVNSQDECGIFVGDGLCSRI